MWSSATDDEQNGKEEPLDLYAILNLNKSATQAEINERYRTLSLLFHPDKQQHPERKEAAEEEFLKVQKAYQVLSDSFLRQVYDVLGIRGVNLKWSEQLTSQSRQKIEEELRNLKDNNFLEQTSDPEASPGAQFTNTTDFSGLFKPIGALHIDRPIRDSLHRLRTVQFVATDLKYTLSKRLNNATVVSCETHAFATVSGRGYMDYTGTIRHQFSPRFTGRASVGLKAPFFSALRGTYRDDYNTVDVNVSASPLALRDSASTAITVARRLFQGSPQMGELRLQLGPVQSLSFYYTSPPSLSQDIVEAAKHAIPSIAGFRHFAFDRKFGLIFSNIIPKLAGEIGLTLVELSVRLKAGFELGFLNSFINLGLGWVGEESEVSFDTTIGTKAVIAKLDVVAWKQQFSLPIVLSTEWNPRIALGAIVLPSVATVLSYHFIVRPRRRARRIQQIRAARRAHEEDSDARRKRNAVVDLLKDVANKYTSLETAKGGLVIQEALYGVTDDKDGAQDLAMDVTVPMQSLVRNSHLYIPGGKSKTHLQGFSDPAPFTAKSLRIRYVFHGRPHYAEIPDYLPVVLPLSEHSVREC
ncbi:hypothetical protein DFP72DRAFT_920701 [Ephemerocybe angulata]|uniref:J domain-containing protein n=1 Tax=Ephemerocybe angulata TaxID=980116 RepID=A0A8H6HHJ3_9AGAR|nr:hypothetical protein DFP72DRAFT_920701 [Tulosesus angulatus]